MTSLYFAHRGDFGSLVILLSCNDRKLKFALSVCVRRHLKSKMGGVSGSLCICLYKSLEFAYDIMINYKNNL